MQKFVNSFDGTKICYDLSRIRGSKKFIVLLHGLGGDYTAWNPERKILRKNKISTLAIDLRGHGLSGRPALFSDYALENFAKDIFCVLKKERAKNFALAGHCFGGIIAMAFHKLYPTLANKYVLIDTTYKAPPLLAQFANTKLIAYFNNILEQSMHRGKKTHVNFSKFSGSGDLNLRRIYSDIAHTSLRSWLFSFENVLKFDGSKILREMKKPVLIVEGEKDIIFNTKIARRINTLAMNSKLDIIPNANHMIIINNPKELSKELLKKYKLN